MILLAIPKDPLVTPDEDVDHILHLLSQVMLSASSSCIPCTYFRPHVRPNWNNDLHWLHALSKSAYLQWVNTSRPTGSHILHQEKVHVFWQALRYYKWQEEDQFLTSMISFYFKKSAKEEEVHFMSGSKKLNVINICWSKYYGGVGYIFTLRIYLLRTITIMIPPIQAHWEGGQEGWTPT